MNSMCDSCSDIISDLPGNVIENILMCLPIKDAGRTSVLSRKWRYNWVKLPQLVFDDLFCRDSMGNQLSTKNKLMMMIYQVLLLHCGPILKFFLNISELESCSEIDQLIIFVLNNGVQELTLHIWRGEPYKLPSSVFSSLQLKHLNLHSCVLKPPPTFKGFSRLLCLELSEIVTTAEVFSNFISSCPLLERLTLKGSTSFEYLEIVAPNLRFLCCICSFRSICLKNTPHLAIVSINLKEHVQEREFKEGETSNSIRFCGSLPVIRSLELNYRFVKYLVAGGVPEKLPTTMNHLKILKFVDICLGELEEVSIALCLIISSPNLQKITFSAFAYERNFSDPILELLEVHGSSDVSLNQLREVNMRKVSGTRSELEFIKLLLAKSPMLEKMLIEPNSEKVADKGLRILKELTRFRRLSPQAEITYKDPNEDQV